MLKCVKRYVSLLLSLAMILSLLPGTAVAVDEIPLFVEVTQEDYRTISNSPTEQLACAPSLISLGGGKLAVSYLADDVNSVETESSTTIVCRLGLFSMDDLEDGAFIDIAAAGQTLGAVTIGDYAPYEPNLLRLNDGRLLVIFNIRDTAGQYQYYSALVDPDTGEVETYQPLTLDGNVWTPVTIAASYNALAEVPVSSSGPAGSMVFTSKIVEHEGYFYGYCGGICSGFSGMLVRSTDGLNWESVMVPEARSEMAGVIECGFGFLGDNVYFCMRDISAGVYQCSYNFETGEQVTATAKIPGLTTSKPAVFVQDGELYLIANKITGDDNTVGRRNTALFFRVNPETCGLTLVKEVFCADGCAYHCVEEVDGVNYWAFHTDARRINPYTQGRSNLASLPVPELAAVQNHTDGELNWDAYQHLYAKGCITTANNAWQENAVNGHYQIPLWDFTEYDTVTVTANSENKAYIAFFTKQMTTAGSVAYADGWTDQCIMEPGTKETFVIPDDATHLYVLATNAAGNNLLPERVVFGEENLGNFADKTISILGDSISTYAGVSNSTAANATLSGGAVYYNGSIQDITRADTWWQQTVDALGLELLVNNSWSGSCILTTRAGTAGAYVNRCVQLHNDKTGEEPDIIAVFLGINDFYNFQSTLGTADIDYDALITENSDGTYAYAAPVTACEAYAIMLHKMTERYPQAEVYCLNMLPTRDPVVRGSNVGQPTAFNAELAEIIETFGCTVVDLENCGIDKTGAVFDQYITDRFVHPGPKGMDMMTQALVRAITGEETGLCNITYDLNHVTADNTARVSIIGDAYSSTLRVADGYENLSVTVTMNGADITETCVSNGVVSIPDVTGDIVITASAAIDKDPENYRWQFDGTELVSVTTGDNVQNTLTKLAGTCDNGTLNGARYQLAEEVVLSPDQPWVVEWECSGAWNGLLLSSHAASATAGMSYLFRSSGTNRLLAFGEYADSRYDNYGIPMAEIVSDPDANHVYRVENRIAADGSNMAYLLVDGTELGAMDDYYIAGSSNQNRDVDWVDGKTFAFGYIGTSGHQMNNANLKYLQIWESGEPEAKALELSYDDHMDVSGRNCVIVDAGTPTSWQVGYGVAENAVRDTAVVTLKGDTLVATGIGTAQVKIDGVTYAVTVEAAPISLLLLAGQSNMQGMDGNASQSVVCPTGQVYATYGDRYQKTVEDLTKFAPSALAGEYSTVNVTGDTACLQTMPVNMLTEAGNGRMGMDSGLAYEWVQQTGEKVWVVNLGYGGSSINQWVEGGVHYNACLDLFAACQETLRKEITAGHFTLSHMGYFWCQGCADETQTAVWYANKFQTMHQLFKDTLRFDHDTDPATPEKSMEFAGIIPIRSGHEGKGSYRAGLYENTTTVPYYQSFKDLRMNGPRVAQYWMGNNPELTDIWNVCTIQEGWATLPDGSDGVAKYFRSAYENGKVDYPVQVQQSASWYIPTTPAAVHDNIHFNQIGYNELGRESARNALVNLGEIRAPQADTTVKFVGWDGFTAVTDVTSSTVGSSGTLVVPMVSPVWKSKDVTYPVTDGLKYTYYDLLTESLNAEGTLSADGAEGTVDVSARELTSYRWTFDGTNLVSDASEADSENPLARLAGSVSDGQFSGMLYQASQTPQLLHDREWGVELQLENWTGTSGSMIFSSSSNATSGLPYLYFRPADFFVGIGYYDGAKYHNYGISLKQHGIDCAEGTHTYRLVNRIAPDGSNMVYLVVDDRDIGPLTDHYINSTLSDTGNNWLNGRDFAMPYLGTTAMPISGCMIPYIAVIEAGYDPNVHIHIWSAWETVSLPGPDGPGEEKRVCADCGMTDKREVEGVWQTHDLSKHLVQLPENTCCGTNLWAELPHDAEYYHSGTHWGIHESGTVYSVTIPVEAGEKVYASSFGKAGENGYASSNGIRCTFFDADGIAKTMGPAEVYAEFSANGYLTAPAGTVAVNVPMWTNSDVWELYLLDREHQYTKSVTPPTCTEQGYTTYTCAACGDSYVDSHTEAFGHSYENGSCTACGTKEPFETMSLRYDDHLDMTGKLVEILDAGAGVVELEGNYLVATGVGETQIRVDGELRHIIVEKAKINIVTIMGQSNAGNHFANATSDVTCPPGTAYWWGNGQGVAATQPVDYIQPSMGFHTPLLAELYAQSVAAGDPVKNVMVWQEGITSKNGQSIVKWAATKDDTQGTDAAAAMIQNCVAYFEQHSDKYEIVGNGVYWLQGESDTSMSPEAYTERFMAMWNRLKQAGAEYVAFFRVRKGTNLNGASHEDLGYTGSLNAQLQMVNHNADMFMASTITENWTGTASVEHSVDIRNYLTLMEKYGSAPSHNDTYGNAATFENGILTTTMKTLYGSNNSCHYGKFGYGIIGADAAFNMHKAMRTNDFSIVKAGTNGHAEGQLVSNAGDEVTIDITGLEENIAFRAACGSTAGTLEVTVWNGAEDITDEVTANGVDTFGTVDTQLLRLYDDPVINVTYTPVDGTAGSVTYHMIDNTPDQPDMYYWDFETDLNARDETGEIVNGFGTTALQGSYVLEGGMLKATGLHLALEHVIRLSGAKEWSIEWKFGEIGKDSNGFLFSSKNQNVIGNKAFYHVQTGQFMISDYVDSKGYRNYTLDDVIVQSGDVMKVTNRFDKETGRSIMSLWQNGTLVIEDFQMKGSFNGFTSDLDMTPYPLSGEFFLGYMGAGKFLPVTDEFEYIRIIPDVDALRPKHKYESAVTPPTCTEQGYTTHTCTACGDSYKADYVEPVWHTYDNGQCSMCGDEMLRVSLQDFVRYQGGVNSVDGTLNTTFTNNWYADIRIPEGAEQVRFLVFKTGGNWGSAFLNGNTYISGICDKTTGGYWTTVDVPEDATTFRYGYLYDSIAANNGYPAFAYLEFVGEDLTIQEDSGFMARPATGCHAFTVNVNIAPAQGNPTGYVEGTDYGYIQLPTNYDPYGDPTRLIIVCHGAGAALSTYQSNAWKNTNYSFWTDLGYAVMDMYACPQELTGSDSCLHYGNPVVLDCYKEGYDYVMEHFNLKQDGVFLIGASMGGLSSFQIAQSGEFPVIAQVGYCPAIDLFKQAYVNPWTTASYQRSRIAQYFGFTGTVPTFMDSKYPSAAEIEYYKANFNRTIPYSPILSNVVSGDLEKLLDVIPSSATAVSSEEEALYQQLTATHPNPVMIFHNTDDSTVSYRYSKYFVDMVNRSGQEAILRTFTSGGHNAWANGASHTVQGLNGSITIKDSQYEAYLFFKEYEEHKTHTGWIDPAVAPTCTEAGLTQGSHCAVCGEVLLKQEVVPETGHSYKAVMTPPTCTQQGYTTHTCAACGDSYVDSYTEAFGHSYENGVCTACGAKEPFETMSLRYDDRLDMTGRNVEIIDAGSPTSYQAGYGTEETAIPDIAVVTLEGDTLIATGIGTAWVSIDGTPYEIVVEKAKINLVMVVGQSNSGNHFPNATSAVVCPPGTAYYWKYGADAPEDYVQPSMGFHAPLLAELYAQSAEAGDPVKNVLLWEEGYTSKNGQSITAWAVEKDGVISTEGTDGAAQMAEDCLAYYERHSDKYEVVNRIVFCNHGTTDHKMDPQRYMSLFTAMWERLKEAGMEYLAFLRVRGAHSLNTAENVDVYYNAASSAQFEMVRNREDMFMATTLAEAWTGPASTVHNIDVSDYITVVETYGKEAEYSDEYGNRASYADGVLTTTMKELYGSNNKVHYGIFGYGLIGADAARNMYAALSGKTSAEVVQTDSSGKKSAEHISAMGLTRTLNIEGLQDNLSFYPSCRSPKGIMSIKVMANGTDITEQVVSKETSVFGTIDMETLRRYAVPIITVSYTSAGGTEEVHYILEFEHPCNFGHNYQSVITPPTCTQQGYTTHTCTACGNSYVDTYVDAKGHSWDSGSVTTQPTCTAEGEKTFTCQNDSTHTRTEAVAKLGHTAGTAVRENEIAATCTEAGRYDTVVYCAVCSAELSRETKNIPALEHSPQVVPAVPPTCDKTGLTEGSHCSVCGTVLKAQEVVLATGPVISAKLGANGVLTISGVISDEESLSTPVFAAVYAGNGQLLQVTQPVDSIPNRLSLTLENCDGAASVRVFRLNAGYLPDTAAGFAAVTP